MNYYEKIRCLIEEKEVNEKVRYLENNNETLNTYYNIGRLLVEAQGSNKRAKYGDNLIKKWSITLSKEYGKGYDYSNLKRMRKLYLTFQKGGSVSHQLTWTHYRYLLSIKNTNEMNYYINLCISNNLSVRGLVKAIKEDMFNRLSYADKENIKLIQDNNISIKDMILDPIIINTSNSNLSEKMLRKYIIRELQNFFLQLGTGFAFIASEYKITIDSKNYYIDLLLFNVNLNRYVAVELKINELKPKDIGQILFYINAVDKNLKQEFNNKTIGIIVSKKNNKFIFEYISDNIFLTTYKIKEIA